MTIEPARFGDARRPAGPRDPGDAWVVAATGERYWGRFGAAGLLALDPARGVLLQHRVMWSHFGGTWALPGGARHQDESAAAAALREAEEEAGVPSAAIAPRFSSVFDLDYWSYTTLVGDVIRPFEPVISDPESTELAWVTSEEVDERPLHPGFADAWPRLRSLLHLRPAVIVDAANVVGSVPDGWWHDRTGAAERLRARIASLAERGVAGDAIGLTSHTWYPEWTMVVEGRARAVPDAAAGVALVRAQASRDDAIVVETRRLVAAGRTVTVVTSDRELAGRVTDAGSAVRGAGWLLDLLPIAA